MKKIVKALLCGALLTALPLSSMAQSPPGGKWVSGYWAGYLLNNPGYQEPQYVDMSAMTHFIFGRIGPGGGQNGGSPGQVMLGGGISQTATWTGPGAPNKTTEDWLIAKAHAAGTKAIIMLGGEGDDTAFRASTTSAVRATFVKNLVDYMVAHDYDGIDVDWEGSATAADEVALEALIADLRAAANARPRYATSKVIITFPAGTLNTNYQSATPHMVRVANLVDQYNLMSYAAGWFGSGWQSTVYNPLTGNTPQRPVSIASTVQMLVNAGIPRSKIGMGIGFYGMNYQPPFTQPGQATDGYPSSKWSINDVYWNYAMLNKHGYLSNGTYVFDTATQSAYRTYGPGGYTPATRSDMPSGYLSYEDPNSIAAKGAWAKSAQAGAGVGGTIIWAVNYGTTNGADNPLLAAVKKAFLDPNATDPNPDPNPPPPPPPPASIATSVTVDNDWKTGYCATLQVTNTGGTPAEWNVALPFKDTVTSLWNGVYSQTATTLNVRGVEWNKLVYPGDPRKVGFCANRAAATTPPSDPPPAPAPGSVSGKVSITNDWTTGYCGAVAVTNSGGSAVANWNVTVPVQGKVVSMWNGKYTQSGSSMAVSGPDWNRDIAAGKTISDIGFCANR